MGKFMSFTPALVFGYTVINVIACTKPYGRACLSICLLFGHIIPAVLAVLGYAYVCLPTFLSARCLAAYTCTKQNSNRSVSYLKTSKLGRLTPMWPPLSS